MKRYMYAKLGRAGLANELFPWARAEVMALETGAELLEPIWFKLRVGPILRRERDKRQYHRLFRAPSLKRRIKRRAILILATRLDETGIVTSRRVPFLHLTMVAGMDDHFGSIGDRQAFIRQRLDSAIRNASIAPTTSSYVSVHVRLGDFLRANSSGRNSPTSIEWFEKIIATLPTNTPIVICSDGTDDQLSPLLVRESTIRTPIGSHAIDDLYVLANSELIIGSGSTYSAWGAFLGQNPLWLETGKNHYLPGSKQVTEHQ